MGSFAILAGACSSTISSSIAHIMALGILAAGRSPPSVCKYLLQSSIIAADISAEMQPGGLHLRAALTSFGDVFTTAGGSGRQS